MSLATRLLVVPVSLALGLGVLVSGPSVAAAPDREARDGTEEVRVDWQMGATYASPPVPDPEQVGLDTVTVVPGGSSSRGPLAYGTTGAAGFRFVGRDIPANSIWVARLGTATQPPTVTSLSHWARGAAGVRIVDVAETTGPADRPQFNELWVLLSMNSQDWTIPESRFPLVFGDPNMTNRAALGAVPVDSTTGQFTGRIGVRGITSAGNGCDSQRANPCAAYPTSVDDHPGAAGRGGVGVGVLFQAVGNLRAFGSTVSAGPGRAMSADVFALVSGETQQQVVGIYPTIDARDVVALDALTYAVNFSGSMSWFDRTVRSAGNSGSGAAIASRSGGRSINDPARFATLNLPSTGSVRITAASGRTVGGSFTGRLTLGGTVLQAAAGSPAPFIARMNADSTAWEWAAMANPAANSGSGAISAITETATGVRVVGTLWGSLAFGPHRVTGPAVSTSPRSLFAAEYVAGRNWSWAVSTDPPEIGINPTSVLAVGEGASAISAVFGAVNGTATLKGVTFGSRSSCGAVTCTAVPFGLGVSPGTDTPSPPNNVTAAGVNGGAYLSWEPPTSDGGSEITSYEATVRNLNGASIGTCRVVPDRADPDLSCTITGLQAGIPYDASVKATNAAGRTSRSSAQLRFVTAAQVPSAPRDVLVIIEVFTGVFQVSWAPPADTGGSAITSYTATARAADGSTRTCTTATNRCNISGLTLGASYAVTVTATNASGNTSPPSPAQEAVAEALPGEVRDLQVFGGNAEVVAQWSPPASDGGSPIIDYTATASSGQTCVAVAPATTCTITGLANGTPVTVSVLARTDVDPGPAVTSGSVTPNAAPQAPTNVALDGTPMNGQATVTWRPAAAGAPAASFEVVAYRVGPRGDLFDPVTCRAGGAERACTFADLPLSTVTEWKTYAFEVVAVGANGFRSVPSRPMISALMIAPPVLDEAASTATARPQAIEVSQIFGTRATPGLTGVATAQPGGRSCTAPVQNGNFFRCTITGLADGTAYTVTMKVTSAAGDSNAITVGPIAPQPVQTVPGAPRNVTATIADDGRATMTWQAPESDGGLSIRRYEPSFVDDQGRAVPCDWAAGTLSCTTAPLVRGRGYLPRVYATNQLGAGNYGFAARNVVFLAAPGSVTELTAAPGPGEVSLQWAAPTDDGGPVNPSSALIKSYTVKSIELGGNGCQVEAPATGCVIRGLQDGKEYTFSVTASNGERIGAAATVTATPRPGVPSAPRNVVARVNDQDGITVTWQAPARDGGSAITSYEVRGTRNGAPIAQPVCDVAGNVLTCTLSAQTVGTGQAWTFSVRAVNATGPGPYSGPSLRALPARVPDAPRPGAAVAGSRSLSLAWSPGSNGGSAITGYLVRLQPGGATCQVAAAVQGCTFDGLTNGTAYTAYVAAINARGYSSYAEFAPATPRATLPSAPTGVQVLANAGGLVQVTWSPPAQLGDAAITGYVASAYAADDVAGAAVSQCTTAGDLTCVIADLSLVVGDVVPAYVVRVQAVTADGNGPESDPTDSFQPGNAGVFPPSAVTDLVGLGEDGCIVVTWAPSADNGGAPIIGQDAQIVGRPVSYGLALNATQWRLCGLDNGTSYAVQITTRNRVGASASEVVEATPRRAPEPPPAPVAEPQAPGAPVGVAGNTIVELTWAAAPTADADQVSGYHVQRRVAGSDAWADVTANTGTSLTRLTVRSLANGRGYEFRVRAINADGAGPWSDASAAVTPRSDRPGAPGRPVGTAGNGEVDLQWAAPQSDGGGEIVGYQVELSTDGQNWSVAIPDTRSSLTSVTVQGLVNGTSYVFRVAAINEAGVGAASDASQASVASEPSAPVQPVPPEAPAPPGPALPPPPPPAPAPVVGPGPAPGPPPSVVPEQPQPGRVASRPEAPTATALVESARVSWKKPANPGTAAVTRYWVQATPGGLGCESTIDEPLSCVVTGLTAGTSYTFTVEAINPVGFSLPSEPSNAVVPTAATKGTITISGSRSKPTEVAVRGTTTGLAAGTKLTPRYRVLVGGKGKWLRGKPITLKQSGGAFTLRLAVKATQTIQVKVLAAGKVKSNTITVGPRR